jgi:hypothetical protein
LFVLVAIVAVLLSFGGKRVIDARKQRQLIALIQSYGGENYYDLHFKNATERTIRFPNLDFSPVPPGPAWMRRLLGEEYFVNVAEAFFDKSSYRVLDDAMFAEFTGALRRHNLPRPRGLVFSELPITDATLQHLNEFPNLTSLHIVDCSHVTDAGMRQLESLKNLRRLDLRGASITDRGLHYLSGLGELRELSLSRTSVSDAGLGYLEKLTNLEWLALSDTAVTIDGAKALKRHLPKCKMSW